MKRGDLVLWNVYGTRYSHRVDVFIVQYLGHDFYEVAVKNGTFEESLSDAKYNAEEKDLTLITS